MKPLLAFFGAVIVISSVFLVFNSKPGAKEGPKLNEATSSTQPPTANSSRKFDKFPGVLPLDQLRNRTALIKTNKGGISIEFFGSEAPKAVSNFIFLAKNGFYDGLTFHRREEGFVIQGGDPAGNGSGGPGYQFEDEPVTRNYDRGIVAMANAGSNTNGSQFFIMLADNSTLPKNYTIFGKVTSDMNVVDQIKVGDKMEKISIN